MTLLRLICLLFLLVGFCFSTTAQSARKSCLNFGKLQLESASWKYGETTLASFLKGDKDSIFFSENGQTFGSFFVRNEQIVSPRIVIRDQQGRIISIDSVRKPSYNEKSESYFGYRFVSLVKWKYGLNGIPVGMILKDVLGRDSLVREWDSNGVLQKEIREGKYRQVSDYYPNGILKSIEKDTLISHWVVKRVRNYSESGIIQKESWFWKHLPCLNWFIYDSKGVLSKTIKQTSLADLRPVSQIAEIEPEILMFIDENAVPGGGQTAFFSYLESKLAHELCKRHVSRDKYVLRFEIQEDGECVYKSIEGFEVTEVESFFKAAIEASPRWAPAKRQGRPCREVFSLAIRIG